MVLTPHPSPASMGEGRQLWATAIELAAMGVPFAMATVVRAARPASCRPGDRAIIHADGRLEGWVGGSCAQPTVVAEALAALRDGESRLVAVTPHHDFPAREGMAVHPMTCISGGEIEVFVEPVVPPPQLIVCGASPVASALVAIGAASGFEVVAVDPDATTNRFPAASHVAVSLEATEGSPLAAPRRRYVVAATHGQWDEAAIEGALRLVPEYVGLVASRTRYEATIADLVASGVAPHRLEVVRSRPGIDLGAKTPAEVALGIVAEIVAFRRQDRPSDSELHRAAASPGHLAPSVVGHGDERLATDPPQADAESSVSPEAGGLVEDPICGMMVDPRTTAHWLDHDGTRWHYCNSRCRRVHARQLGIELPVPTPH